MNEWNSSFIHTPCGLFTKKNTIANGGGGGSGGVGNLPKCKVFFDEHLKKKFVHKKKVHSWFFPSNEK